MMAFVWVMAPGCCFPQTKATGSLTHNGQTSQATDCSSLQRIGAEGVEVVTEDASRVRIIAAVDGNSSVVWFPPESPTGKDLGKCVELKLERTNSTHNGVRLLNGSMKLDCTTDEGKLTGSVTFENCHGSPYGVGLAPKRAEPPPSAEPVDSNYKKPIEWRN
jgi:hypothetical protein